MNIIYLNGMCVLHNSSLFIFLHAFRFSLASCLHADNIVIVGGIGQVSNRDVVILNIANGDCKKFALQVRFFITLRIDFLL